VLLYHWDVDHKRLQLPMDAIGRREKQEMLRAIANTRTKIAQLVGR